jgi:hypothetical protein
MTRAWVGVTLLAALCAPLVAQADPAAHYEHRLDRLVATPGPVATSTIAGEVRVFSDATTYRVQLASGVVVQVTSDATTSTATFYLRAYRLGETPPLAVVPAAHAQALVRGPGTFLLEVDPAVGEDVHILSSFDGFVSDVGGAPATFAWSVASVDHGCAAPGVCLP